MARILFSAFVAVETFVFLAREDRWSVLFFFTKETWLLVTLLWVKDAALALLAAALFAALVSATARLERRAEARAVRAAAGVVAVALLAAGIGVALRFAWPETIPPGLWFDPPFEARALLEKPDGLPWIGGVPLHADPAGSGNRELVSYVYLHFYDAVFRVFGRAEAGFGALSAVPGALAIPAAAWLAWEMSGGFAAALAAVLVALGLWPLVFARWGYTAAALIPLALLAGAAALAALRTRRRSLAFLAGAAIGLSLHTHSSSWAIAAGLGVYSLALLRAQENRELVLTAWLAAGLAFLPFGMGYLRNPANLGGRIRDVPAGSRVQGAYGPSVTGPLRVPATLFTNALDYAGVLVWTPDPNPRDGLPERTAVHPLLGIAALAGFARAAARRTRADLVLLALAGGSLAAGILSNPGGAPNTIRTCVFVPAALLAASGVLATGLEALVRSASVRAGAAAAGFAAAVLALETSPFVARWPAHPSVLAHFCVPETSAARLVRGLGEGRVVLGPGTFRYRFVFDALSGPVDAATPIRIVPVRKPGELGLSPGEAVWYVARRTDHAALAALSLKCARGIAATDLAPDVLVALVKRPPP